MSDDPLPFPPQPSPDRDDDVMSVDLAHVGRRLVEGDPPPIRVPRPPRRAKVLSIETGRRLSLFDDE